MFGGDDDFFGDLFDLDGDGKTSFEEAFLAHELFMSDEERKLEYGESDDDNLLSSYEDEDDEESDSDEIDDDSDEDDYGNSDTDDYTVTVPVSIKLEFGTDDSAEGVKRSDYLNERTYQAAEMLDSIERYPDIYGKTDYSKEIEKCRFILDNPNVTAAKYCNYQYGFLFAQAVKERFKLPINIPNDDNEIHTTFPELFDKMSRFNVEYAVRIWHWVLTMFSPYIKYGDDRGADELTSFIMCDIEEKQLLAAASYAEAHPHFVSVFLKTMPDIPCSTEEWLCLCIQNNAKNTAKTIFKGCLSSDKVECDAKERFVSCVLEKTCNYDETDTAKFFRDVLLPIVPKYADKPMKRKMSEWQSDISEYIKNNTEEPETDEPESDWRENCAYMRKSGIEPNNYESEDKCRKAYQDVCEAERQKQKEQRDAEINRRMTLCKELENGENITRYIYCAVLLPSVPHPYHYRTTDESIKIGDKVVVPVGEDNKEMTGTVASVEIHTELTVPFPIDRTKQILRKC